jgi:hypothetical protein
MADLFSTNTLNAIVQDLRVPRMGIAAAYFNRVSQDDTEEIHFDVDNKPRRMAPFVSPLVAGQTVASRGFQTTTFKPAYIKDKRVFSPTRAVKRVMGERIGGGDLTPEQRMQALVVMDLQDQIEMIERRMEWMAAQVMNAGAVTITGDQYPTAVVNFGRHADLTKTLTTTARWGESGVKPLDDMQDWSDLMVRHAGVACTDWAMTVDAWKIFRADADVAKRLDRDPLRDTSTLQPAAHQGEGLQYQGTIDGFNIYTYAAYVINPANGQEEHVLPTFTVLGMGGQAVEGMRHFGAILDHDSLQALPYYSKSWLEQDPSTRYLMMQSAPLLVPYRPNATFRAKVR